MPAFTSGPSTPLFRALAGLAVLCVAVILAGCGSRIKVVDAETGKPIRGAVVQRERLSATLAMSPPKKTDWWGAAYVDLAPTDRLHISSDGYRRATILDDRLRRWPQNITVGLTPGAGAQTAVLGIGKTPNAGRFITLPDPQQVDDMPATTQPDG